MPSPIPNRGRRSSGSSSPLLVLVRAIRSSWLAVHGLRKRRRLRLHSLSFGGDFPALRLIIVPRHVERSDAIVRELAPLRITRRSELPQQADALLIDATGELRDWYRLATVVFVGKSLPGIAQVGGQNAGEPAAIGVPVVFGPHMENFQALTRHLLEKEAAVQISDAGKLTETLRRLLSDAALCQAIGARARAVLEPHQGATGRTAEKIQASSRVAV